MSNRENLSLYKNLDISTGGKPYFVTIHITNFNHCETKLLTNKIFHDCWKIKEVSVFLTDVLVYTCFIHVYYIRKCNYVMFGNFQTIPSDEI
jgi:hypothetical protein